MSPRPPERSNSELSRKQMGLLAIAFAVAAAFRLAAASGPAMWRDEAQFIAVLQLGDVRTMFRFLANHESHPPLYYLLAKGWGVLFGYGDPASVALSVIFGLLLVVVAYVAGRTLFSPGAGLLAALLVSTSSTLIFASASARPYGFLGVAALVSTTLAWRFAESGTWRSAGEYLTSAAVLVYTHHWAWVILAAHGLLGLWTSRERHGTAFLHRWLIAYAALIVLYLPWLPILVLQTRQAGHPPSLLPLSRILYKCMFFLTGLPPDVGALCVLSLGALMVLDRTARDGGGQPMARRPSVFLISTVMMVTGLAVAALPVANLLVPHCFSVVTPVLLVGVAGLVHRDRSHHRLLAAGVATVMVVASTIYSAGLWRFDRTNVDEVAGYVAREAQAGDLVLLMPIYLAPSFMRYYSGAAPVVAYPDESVRDPTKFDHRLVRDTASAVRRRFSTTVDVAAQAHRRIWLVAEGRPDHVLLNERWGVAIEALEAAYDRTAVTSIGRDGGGFFETVYAFLYVPRANARVARDATDGRPAVRPPD